MSQLLHQVDMDVERLRKSADRISELREAHRQAIQDRANAISALKVIATWAKCMRLTDPLEAAKDAAVIRQRALDTLRLMGEIK